MAAQGFASDTTTWADATEEKQKKMEENLLLPEEIPPPFLEKFPALPGARRSSVSARGMAKALLSDCAS
eukprot:11679680-Karenia_brevis.AAC.1